MDTQDKKEIEVKKEVVQETKATIDVKVTPDLKIVDPLPEIKEVPKKKPSMLFVDETDTFTLSLKYYIENKRVIVEDDEDILFDVNHAEIQELTCVFKYPNQGDSALIARQSIQLSGGKKAEQIDLRDFMQLEFVRLMVLIRSWNLEDPVNNANLLKLPPKVVKGLIAKMRTHINMDGIF